MRGGAMRSILIIGTLTLVGIAGLWFLFGDSTEVFELLYSSPTTIRIEGDTIDLDIVRYGEKKQISFRICNTGEVHDIIFINLLKDKTIQLSAKYLSDFLSQN